MNISRRDFFKTCLSYGATLSLSVGVSSSVFYESDKKFISEKFYLMGTCGKIQIFTDNIDYGTLTIKKAINRIKEIEYLLTKFSPYSDIGKINMFPNLYHSVSNETLYVLNYGIKLSDLTFGFFDMGLGNVLSMTGIDEHIPMVGDITKLKNMKENLLQIYDNKVKLNRKNSMLDLGGIGKGYALDEAMQVFLNNGINHVAIEFGGDIKVNAGMPSGLPWTILYSNKIMKISKNNIKFVDLYTGSIAVSGGYLKKSSYFPNYHHIINPKSLKSDNKFSIVVVFGAEALVCDVLSTACYNMNSYFFDQVKTRFNDYTILTYI